MRTQEQIKNLRVVWAYTVGPFVALLASDEQVNLWGDLLQEEINIRTKHTWLVQIQTVDQKEISWKDLAYEPKRVVSTFVAISFKINDLLTKYPQINAIRIASVEDQKECVFLQNEIF